MDKDRKRPLYRKCATCLPHLLVNTLVIIILVLVVIICRLMKMMMTKMRMMTKMGIKMRMMTKMRIKMRMMAKMMMMTKMRMMTRPTLVRKCSSYNHLVGLVVRHPPRERKILGSNPACAGIFSGSSHTGDLKIGIPVAILPGAWGYRVSTGTGQPCVSIL